MQINDWNDRYLLQAFWTLNLRKHILSKINAQAGLHVLDVGSGTGALFRDFQNDGFRTSGIDLDLERCEFSKPLNHTGLITCGNASAMPYKDAAYDLTFCHYFLLWTKIPQAMLSEFCRVTKSGGYVIAFAEPDYQSRIDYPEIFQQIGQMQNRSLKFQGVDLAMGRKLGALFRESGLRNVRVGLLAGEWKEPTMEVFSNEWDIIAYDLGGFTPSDDIPMLMKKAREAWLSGSSTVFIPTFYAYGQVD